MHTLVLSDLDTKTLHHAYACESNDAQITADTISQWWNNNCSPEVQVLQFQTLGIDDAQELSRLSRYTTDSACIVITATSLTREAQNALLKLFEEPVAGIHFFLVLPAFDIVLPTLASRLQKISIEIESEEFFSAEKFLKDSPEKRLATIEKLLKKADEGDEAKSAITRVIADGIENALVGNPKLRNPKTLKVLQTIRSYQNLQGASHKILLEYISFI